MFRSKEGESVAQQIRREQQMDFSLPLVRAESEYMREIRELGKASEQKLLNNSPNNRDYLLVLARAYFDQDKFNECRLLCEQLLVQEPNNRQALELRALATDKLKNYGSVGLAVAGGAVFIAGLAALGALALLRGRR